MGLLAALLLLGIASPALADADTWYAERITVGDVPVRVEHLWSKGGLFLSHTVVGGRPIVTIVNGEYYYALDPLNFKGVAVRRAPAAMANDGHRRPMGREPTQMIGAGAEKVRTEEVRGRMCDVYRLTDGMGQRELWVTQDAQNLPLRLQQYIRQTKQSVHTDYLEWSHGFDVPDAYFTPDPRIEIERLELDAYHERASKGPLTLPVLYSDLLHGDR